MSTKKIDLTTVGDYYYYVGDLKIEPPIGKVSHSGSYYDLKTIKDENVEFINGEIKVVATEVTSLKQLIKETDSSYNPDGLRQEVEQIAAIAKANKANLNGQVVIKQCDSQNVFRITVVNNKVEVQSGKLVASWPDGTTSLLPKGNG